VEAWGRITGASPWPRPGRDGERAGRSGRFPVGFGAIARQRAAEDGAAVPAVASAGRCKAVSLGALAVVDREAAPAWTPGLLASSDDDLPLQEKCETFSQGSRNVRRARLNQCKM